MPVREKDENLNAVQYNGEIYYQTTKAIPAGKLARLRNNLIMAPCKSIKDDMSEYAG